MPRVYNTGANVDRWYEQYDEGSSMADVCQSCAEDLRADPHCYDDTLQPYQRHEPQGEDGWEVGCDHPDYDDEDYECEVCGATLTSRDD